MEAKLYTMKLFFSFTASFQWTFIKISYYFLLCTFNISRLMLEKQNLKFERDDMSDGDTLVHPGHICGNTFLYPGLIVFFYCIFLVNIQNDFLLIFILPVNISRLMIEKKTQKSRGMTQAMKQWKHTSTP